MDAHVTAQAVNTLDWLAGDAVVVVPIYQRKYRWTVDGCERLLDDLRSVARDGSRAAHFFGSILYAEASVADETQRMLIDGQQRIATVMLLVAALRDTFSDEGAGDTNTALELLVQHPHRTGEPRLRLRGQGAVEFAAILSGLSVSEGAEISHLWNNYNFFRSQVRQDAGQVWEGLHRLEHVAVSISEGADVHQVFESLNSTGEPLRDHELIHNHVLMGLNSRQQETVETDYWIPIESRVGEAVDNFFRDYLILKTGRDSDFVGDHGVFEVFKQTYATPRYDTLLRDAEEWRFYANIYRVLRQPNLAEDETLRRQLRNLNTFGRAAYPYLMAVIGDHQSGRIDGSEVSRILRGVESLYLRRTVVGSTRDHLAAQMCRGRLKGHEPVRIVGRLAPSDERVRQALAQRPLPHADFVLRRLEEAQTGMACDPAGLEVEHIFPQFPAATWSGDGVRSWHKVAEDEQAVYRERLNTIGNLTLLEQPLNAAAGNLPFADKRAFLARSRVESTCDLAGMATWNLDAIRRRTTTLTERFLEIWPGADAGAGVGSDALVPILDAPRRPGYYPGWKDEFEYVVFRGETWEVRNAKELFERVFTHLWETHREAVLRFSAANEGPVFATQEWRSRWKPLGDHYLFMALFPQYMLGTVRKILDELDLADEVLIKYAEDE